MRDILHCLTVGALGYFFVVRSTPRRVSLETYQVLALLRPAPAPATGEFLATLEVTSCP